MSERLDRIAAQQEANTQAIAALVKQLRISGQEHDRRMADHDQRIAENKAQQEANMQAIAAFAEQLTISTQEHDRRMADHNRHLAEIDQRLARLTQLAERFVNQTLSHEERISVLERA